jgi:hypothetical protein
MIPRNTCVDAWQSRLPSKMRSRFKCFASHSKRCSNSVMATSKAYRIQESVSSQILYRGTSSWSDKVHTTICLSAMAQTGKSWRRNEGGIGTLWWKLVSMLPIGWCDGCSGAAIRRSNWQHSCTTTTMPRISMLHSEAYLPRTSASDAETTVIPVWAVRVNCIPSKSDIVARMMTAFNVAANRHSDPSYLYQCFDQKDTCREPVRPNPGACYNSVQCDFVVFVRLYR